MVTRKTNKKKKTTKKNTKKVSRAKKVKKKVKKSNIKPKPAKMKRNLQTIKYAKIEKPLELPQPIQKKTINHLSLFLSLILSVLISLLIYVILLGKFDLDYMTRVGLSLISFIIITIGASFILKE